MVGRWTTGVTLPAVVEQPHARDVIFDVIFAGEAGEAR
jgi:hypothetical protein